MSTGLLTITTKLLGATLGLWLACAPAHARSAPLVGSDSVLSFMKKVQGQWQRDCRKVVSRGQVVYEQTLLSVSFTHFTFKTTEYSNDTCVKKIRNYQTPYRFQIVGVLPNQGGVKVHAIDLIPEGAPVGVVKYAVKNLLQFKDGHLFFGLAEAGAEPAKRLTKLDRKLGYQRFY